MVLFFPSSYGEVWNELVAGLEWAKRLWVGLALGMQPTAAAITYARGRLGWEVMARLREQVAGPLAGQESASVCVRDAAGRGGRDVCGCAEGAGERQRSSSIRATTSAGAVPADPPGGLR